MLSGDHDSFGWPFDKSYIPAHRYVGARVPPVLPGRGHRGRELTGTGLEAGLRVDSEWLLFLTHDVPFEESLDVYLFGSNFEVLERATLTGPYITGRFEDLAILSERQLRFRFLGEGWLRLDLLRTPGFRWPLISEL